MKFQLTESEIKKIYALAQALTGMHPDGTYQHAVFLSNIEKRMLFVGVSNLSEYLKIAENDPDEHEQIVSALSIHTTSWFRENPHFVIFQKIISDSYNKKNTFKMWCSACSTGEEVYSFALILEEFKRFHSDFEYQILGTDIDSVSLNTAKKAVYLKKNLMDSMQYYKKHVLLGSGTTADYFTFSKSLRNSCRFEQHDIRRPLESDELFDLVVTRNVLIYFSSALVTEVVGNMLKRLAANGYFIMGHSEYINHLDHSLVLKERSVYQFKPKLFDSPTKEEKENSSLQVGKLPAADFSPHLILIGVSTGGPQTLSQILKDMPENCPPVVIVQHIDKNFTKTFCEQLSLVTNLKFGKMQDGAALKKNHFYTALDQNHIAVEYSKGELILKISNAPPLNGYCPSVDYLFLSAAKLKLPVIAMLLTGMGKDGAMGIKELHNRGAYCIAQSSEDAVVYGMPKEAIESGAIDYIDTAHGIRDHILKIIS